MSPLVIQCMLHVGSGVTCVVDVLWINEQYLGELAVVVLWIVGSIVGPLAHHAGNSGVNRGFLVRP